MGRSFHEFNIPTKYLFTLVIFNIISNPQIQMSTNIFSVVKSRNSMPKKFYDFLVCLKQIHVSTKTKHIIVELRNLGPTK